MAEKVPGWLERLLLPKLSLLEGEAKALRGEVNGRFNLLEGELKAFRGEVEGEFKSVHSEIKRLDNRIDGIEKRLDLSERLTSLEAKVEALQAGKT